MSIVKEKYSSSRINMLHQMLVNDKEQGHPRDYDIKVDELKVIQRTDDPERFFMHEEFVQPETGCITVSIYDGGSRRCTRYQLYFGDVQPGVSVATLSGIEKTIKEKISTERKQWEYEQVKKEKEALENSLAESEEYAEGLQTRLENIQQEFEDYKTKKVGLAEMSTGKMLGFATDYLVKSHPGLTKKIPILSGLSGLLTGEETPAEGLGLAGTTEKESSTETMASFSKKQQQNNAPQYDAATSSKLAFLAQMEVAFSEEQLEKVVEIIQELVVKTELLDTVYDLVHDESETEKEAA